MVTLPLIKRLRKQIHKDIALAQDIMINEIYNHLNDAILHGGTAIWRCYNGARFSEDIDIYLPTKYKKMKKISDFIKALETRGFITNKFREKENSIYAKFRFNNIIVSFEAVFETKKDSIIKPFELTDGNFLNVFTFLAETLINEKVSAYLSRRKIRDLYDIFFLLNFVKDRKKIEQSIKSLLQNFKDPIDSTDLPSLVIIGVVPKTNDMLEVIKR
ncbi:MAG: nucleotidyl transferase AbiEii/AbiGii toxin family protein [Candidatus Aenigmatarchaeota archaeon]